MTDDNRFWVGPPTAPDTYQLIDLIGGGAEGEVWTAVLPLSAEGRRNVAVKILPEGSGADEDAWVNHGNLLRSLGHPGLVRVLDAFTGPAKHRAAAAATVPSTSRYVVMELVEGVSLREWLDEHPAATVSQRLRPLNTVAAALDEMHSGSQTNIAVAHGDVKPSNIIIRPDGSTVLVDLGLIRLADGAGRGGRSRPYAAPEIFAEDGRSTPAADRFAFFATVVHALLGEAPPLTPTGGPDLNAVYARLQAHPLTARRPALVNLLMTALSAHPQARPAPLRAWLSSLTDTLSQVTETGDTADTILRPMQGPPTAQFAHAGQPFPPAQTQTQPFAPPPPRQPVPAREGRGRRGLLVSGIVALIVIVLAVVIFVVTRSGGGDNKNNASSNTSLTPSATVNTPSPTPSPIDTTELGLGPSGVPTGLLPTGDLASGLASPSPELSDTATSPTDEVTTQPPTGGVAPVGATPIAGDDDFIVGTSGTGWVDTNSGNIEINGKTSIDGLQVGANSCCSDVYQESIDINLGRTYSTFYARVGVDDDAEAGIVDSFKVYADGKQIYTKNLKLGQSVNLSLPVTGILRLEIDVEGKLDHAHFDIGDPSVA